jgi:hypothetical protein
VICDFLPRRASSFSKHQDADEERATSATRRRRQRRRRAEKGGALFINCAASDLRIDIANAVALTNKRPPQGAYVFEEEEGLLFVKGDDDGWRFRVPDHEPTRVRVMQRVHDGHLEDCHSGVDHKRAPRH